MDATDTIDGSLVLNEEKTTFGVLEPVEAPEPDGLEFLDADGSGIILIFGLLSGGAGIFGFVGDVILEGAIGVVDGCAAVDGAVTFATLAFAAIGAAETPKPLRVEKGVGATLGAVRDNEVDGVEVFGGGGASVVRLIGKPVAGSIDGADGDDLLLIAAISSYPLCPGLT